MNRPTDRYSIVLFRDLPPLAVYAPSTDEDTARKALAMLRSGAVLPDAFGWMQHVSVTARDLAEYGDVPCVVDHAGGHHA